MALNAGALSALIRSKLLADPATHAVDNDALTAFCDCIAAAVIEHIIAAAVVTIGTAIATGAMGGGPGVPVTGTGTIA